MKFEYIEGLAQAIIKNPNITVHQTNWMVERLAAWFYKQQVVMRIDAPLEYAHPRYRQYVLDTNKAQVC